MKHTPGPWEVTHGLNEGYIASESQGFVPIRTPFREGVHKHNDPEVIANAHLIAASPDLLAAAEKAAEYLRSVGQASKGPGLEETYCDVMGAIQAARGKQR